VGLAARELPPPSDVDQCTGRQVEGYPEQDEPVEDVDDALTGPEKTF